MRQGAVIILRRQDGSVLMQHRDNKPEIANPDYWALPAGAVEADEDPKQAAIRELAEETSYRVTGEQLTLVGQASQQIRDEAVLRSIYLTEYDGIQPIECLEGREMRFVHPSEFPDLKVFEDHVTFIQQGEQLLSSGNPEVKG